MRNQIEVFKNNEFGQVRTINDGGKILFVASDVAKALGYTNTSKAINDHCKGVTKRYIPHPQGKGTIEVNIIPEGDIYRLITHSKLPAAEKFESWVFDEVLPSIRKTGTYSKQPTAEQKKRLEVMERNAKVNEAKLWAALAQEGNETFRQICRAYAANTLAEKEVIELPVVTQRTYTATEVGEILGISAAKVGKLANKYGLKTQEYGSWYHDKSRYSNKEVESFRYNKNAIDALENYLNEE